MDTATMYIKYLCLSGMQSNDQPKVLVKKKEVYVCETEKSSDHSSCQHTTCQNSVEIRERYI